MANKKGPPATGSPNSSNSKTIQDENNYSFTDSNLDSSKVARILQVLFKLSCEHNNIDGLELKIEQKSRKGDDTNESD